MQHSAYRQLIPLPREIEERTGSFNLTVQPWFGDRQSLNHKAIAYKLSQEWNVTSSVSAFLPAHTLCAGRPTPADDLPPEQAQGYTLVIDEQGVTVRGRDADGLYWGLVSLDQLMRHRMAQQDGSPWPGVVIRDWPCYPLRGHHDDVSRKQISTIRDFQRIIRRLSRYKINLYTPYIEDVLYLDSYPDIGLDRGRLTPKEVAVMQEEAERHNITLMPTYSLIGHQENLLAQPGYAHLGRKVFQPMSSLDVTNPEVREFLEKAIGDVCKLFTGPYFHGCFDETQGVAAEEFLAHANWCARQLKRYGKKMPIWVDMIYNHFGCDMVQRLEDNIIPVVWRYGDTEQIKHLEDIAAQGRPIWGLAGYNSWSRVYPHFAMAKQNIAAWAREGQGYPIEALMASQWGDNGYENHRDLCWNLFAFLGETSWRGDAALAFESRFQQDFYGIELPMLTPLIVDLPDRCAMDTREYWRLFRQNAFADLRWGHKHADQRDALHQDRERIAAAIKALDDARDKALVNKVHLDHFRICFMRMLHILQRLEAAMEPEQDATALMRHANDVIDELRHVKILYEQDWLRNNKRPNIETSLAIYDEIEASYRRLARGINMTAGAENRYFKLDLSKMYNADIPAIHGIPIGTEIIQDKPFLFAGYDQSYIAMNAGQPPVTLTFPILELCDVHLIASAQRKGLEPVPCLSVELLLDNEPVFRENLRTIRELCDWWAPLGGHIWAGGGLRHADPDRVHYALKPGDNYGLCITDRFKLPKHTKADTLRLTGLAEEDVQIFAATMQLPNYFKTTSEIS